MFGLAETKEMITEKWFAGKGREAEAEEMFSLFDRKEKGLVGLNEIGGLFLLTNTSTLSSATQTSWSLSRRPISIRMASSMRKNSSQSSVTSDKFIYENQKRACILCRL